MCNHTPILKCNRSGWFNANTMCEILDGGWLLGNFGFGGLVLERSSYLMSHLDSSISSDIDHPETGGLS
jgi:hypothetical protein